MSELTSSEPPSGAAILAGERVAFTGVLASMTHRQAAGLVTEHGGTPVGHVSQLTTLLVVGEEGWPLEADGQPSVKLVQAQSWQQRGAALRILSESEWLSALGLESPARRQQLYTPAMLSQLLGVSVHEIRRWERLGLIRPVRRVLRLPYFDFSEVTAAKRLQHLVSSGIAAEELATSLRRLQAVLPGLDRPLAQLEILARDAQVLYRDAKGWIEPRTGQRVLEFDEETAPAAEPAPVIVPLSVALRHPQHDWSADDWFAEGCRLADEGATAAAAEALRLALMDRPQNAEYHFHLADALYRRGNLQGAIERFYVAVECDHEFIEAWTQLGCVLAEVGDYEAARDALQVALDRHPDYPEARFHLAQVFDRLGQSAEAVRHWRQYLTYDQFGPWADLARQRLKGASVTTLQVADTEPPPE